MGAAATLVTVGVGDPITSAVVAVGGSSDAIDGRGVILPVIVLVVVVLLMLILLS